MQHEGEISGAAANCRCIRFAPWVGALLVVRNMALAHAQDDEEEETEYPHSNPPVWQRHSQGGDLLGPIAADRPLSREDLELVANLSDHLIFETGSSHRYQAARELGYLGHKYAIPALVAVIRDERESRDLRAQCIVALGMIRDKRVVDILIDEVLIGPGYEDQVLAALVGLAGKQPELRDISYAGGVRWPSDDPKQRAAYRETWRRWWKEVRENTQLGRGLSKLAP